MKKITLFLKNHKFDLLLILLLLVLVYKAWATLPLLTVRSDGFVYMFSGEQRSYWGRPFPITGIQAAAHIAGFILPKIFGVNLSYYYWLEVFFLAIIAVLFYIALKVVTKNILTAFAASLIASVSYFGVYDMVSTHCYCFFFERIVIVPFLIISFIFLHQFLEYGKKKYYFYSLLFYILGIGLGYFNLLFTPIYFFYPIFWRFLNKGLFKERIKGLYCALPYLLLSGLFNIIHAVRDGAIAPHKWTFMGFLLHPEKYLYIKQIALQFVYWSQLPIFLIDPSRNAPGGVIDYRVAPSYIPLTLIVYALAGLIIYVLLSKQRPMLFTILFATPIIFYFNAYLGQYDVLTFPGASRYLYIPTFLLAIFWSYFLWAVFWRRKDILIGGGILILVLYFIINEQLITVNNNLATQWSKSARIIFDYVIATRKTTAPDTLIVVTYPEFGTQEATFFTEQIGKGEVRYMTDFNLVNSVKWEEIASSSAHVVKLRYDEKCNCVSEEKIK